MLPSGLWRRMGADVAQLKAILTVKLKMDDRKPLTMGRQQPNKKKKIKYASTVAFILSFFVGFMYIFPLIVFEDPYLKLFGLYTMLTVLLTFGLVTDFSNVLVDTRDKLIIFPKPVSYRTIFLSRVLHIFIYFFRSVFPMSLMAWIVWGILYGWKGALWFPIPLFFLTLMSLFFVMGCYSLLLKITKPEKFKDVIGYFQIFFSILVFTTYYMVMPQMRNQEVFQQFDIKTIAWIKYTPTYWLASCWYWVQPKAAVLAGTGWLSILAVLAPFIMLWVTVKFFAPSFIRKLSAIDGVEVEAPKKRVKQEGKSKLYISLANMFNRTSASKAGFSIAWLQTSRSRAFKMRVYPGFAYTFVYFFYLFMNTNVPFSQVLDKMAEGKSFLFLLYFTSFMLLNAVSNMNMTEQYKASWIYYTSPLAAPGRIMGGAFKAMWVKYYLPFVIVVAVFVLSVWGIDKWIDVLLAITNVTTYTLILMYLGNRHLPFSMPEQMKTKAGKAILKMLFAFLFMGGMGLAHYALIFTFVWIKMLLALISMALLWTIWDSYINTSWKQLKIAEDAY